MTRPFVNQPWLHSSVGQESACNARDPNLIPASGRSPGENIGYPLQYLWASLVAQLVKNPPAMRESWVQPLGLEDPLERKWQSTLVLSPREFHGQRSLVGSSPWSHKELDTTEQLHFYFLSTQTDVSEIRRFRKYPTHSGVITGELSGLSLTCLPSPVTFWLEMLGETLTNHSPWPGTRGTIFMSYLTTEGPGKEQGTNKTPSTGRAGERSKGYNTTCPPNLPESSSPESILAEQCVRHQEGP